MPRFQTRAARYRTGFEWIPGGPIVSNISGSISMDLAFSGTVTGQTSLSGSTTFTLAFGGTLAGVGALVGATTFNLAFSGSLGAQIPISGSIPLALAFTGTLSTNLLAGSITMALGFAGTLDVPVIPVVDPCDKYQCDSEIESVGSAIVAAGYRLATDPALELADRAAPRLANNSIRLNPSVVTCRTIRKS